MSTPLEITIDSEAVEREVVSAIVAGSIGDAISKAVDEALKPSRFGNKSLLEAAIEAEIKRAVGVAVLQQLGAEPVASQIRDAIRSQLTNEAILTITGRAVQKMLDLPE